MSALSIKKIAIVGNPNSGKTSIFNALTGLSHKTGNFAGVTVEKVSHLVTWSGIKIELIDLPGAYNLYGVSEDEKITAKILVNIHNESAPDLILYVASAVNLDRHLLFLTQIIDLNFPVILCLNKIELTHQKNLGLVSSKFFDLPTVETSVLKNIGINNLKSLILNYVSGDLKAIADKTFLSKNNFDQFLTPNTTYKEYIKTQLIPTNDELADPKLRIQLLDFEVTDVMTRYNKLDQFIFEEVHRINKDKKKWVNKLDRVLLNPFWGCLIFCVCLFFLFQALFSWATYPMDLIDDGILSFGSIIKNNLPNHFIFNFVTEALLPGISGILVFVPQIAFLFLFLACLEESGYMSRVVYLTDFLMQKMGLNGRSIIALISSSACAIPSIMGTRTISNSKERLITILISPIISCSARLPVYILLIGFVVPNFYLFNFINVQGLVLMLIYVIGLIFALLLAWILKLGIGKEEQHTLLVELPDYQWPVITNVLSLVWIKVKSFVFQAGKIILVISIILWFLTNFPNIKNSPENGIQSLRYQQEEHKLLIEDSYAGWLGKKIEPIVKPLGFDWKIGIALITSFAAREVFVSTMATIYASDAEVEPEKLHDLLKKEINPQTGLPIFNRATSASLIVFYMFALQCMSTLAVVKKETNSWKWPIFQLLLFSSIAYVCSFIVYNLLN